MKKQANINHILKDGPTSSLMLLKKNKSTFLMLLLFIILPLIILSSIIFHYVYISILPILFNIIIYSILFLYIISFITLSKVSNHKIISYDKVFRFIPSILPQSILPILLFALAISLSKLFFFIAPFILFVIFPVISFISFFNQDVSVTDIFNANFEYNKSPKGKKLIKNIFILSFILAFTLGIISFFLRGMFSMFYGNLYFITLAVVNNFMFAIAFLTLYFSAAQTYTNHIFLIPNNILLSANDILANRKSKNRKRSSQKRERFVSKKIHSHEKTGNSFEKETPKQKNTESNRFTDDAGGFNRFEDTKF